MKINSIGAMIVLCTCLSACSSGLQKYTCDNGSELHASFDNKEVKWSLRKPNMIMDMVPMPKVEDGKYQRKSSTIQRSEKGDVILDTTEVKTVCHIKK